MNPALVATTSPPPLRSHTHSAEMAGMPITIRSLVGKRYVLDVDASDTIEVVWQKFSYALGEPPLEDGTYLTFAGKRLEHHKTLADYNIQKDSTIYQVLRLRFGAPGTVTYRVVKEEEGKKEDPPPPPYDPFNSEG